MSRLWKKFAVRTGLAALDPGVKRRLGAEYFYLRMYSSDILAAPVDDLEILDNLDRAKNSGAIDLSQGTANLSGLFPLAEIMGVVSGQPDIIKSLQHYPPAFGQRAALDAVAKKIAADTGVSYDPSSEILLCNGASQGLAHALDCFVDPGESIVLLDPCYLFYSWLAQTRGVKIRRVRGPRVNEGVNEGVNQGFNDRVNQGRLKRAMRGAKAIIVNSPANPDGSMIHPDDLQLIADLAKRYNCVILSDEVYSGFCWERNFTSIASLPAAWDRTVVISSLSKSHGLPGLRAGWCAGPGNLIRPLAMLMSIRVPCVSAAVQAALPDLIAAENDFAPKRRTEFLRRRESAIFAARSAGLTVQSPDGAFYLWAQVPSGFSSGHEFTRWCLERCGVLVMAGEPFGPSGKSMVRLSWGGASEPGKDFREAMARIAMITQHASAQNKPGLSPGDV